MSEVSAVFRLVVTADAPAQGDSIVQVTCPILSLDRSRMTIGRRPYNDIVLDHRTVSGEHALLERKGASYELVDIGSSNGSFVNRLRVTRKKLVAGEYVGIGVYQLQLVNDGSSVVPKAEIAPESGQCKEGSSSGQIEYLSGPLKGITQQVDRSLLKIGRGSQVAIIGRRKAGFYLTHLEGLTATLLNGEALSIGARNLADGDLIKLGEMELRFRAY